MLSLDGVITPRLPAEMGEGLEIEATELLEWIGLVMLDSPRVRQGDEVDRLLSRYDVPVFSPPVSSAAAAAAVAGADGANAAPTEDDCGISGRDEVVDATMQDPSPPSSTVKDVKDIAPAVTTNDLVRLRWHGFIPPAFITTVLSILLKTSNENEWFALRASAFDGKSYTVLCPGDGRAMTWECA